MTVKELKQIIDHWEKSKFTGIVTIEFHEGGLRRVKREHTVVGVQSVMEYPMEKTK